jgi:hypothetical protein
LIIIQSQKDGNFSKPDQMISYNIDENKIIIIRFSGDIHYQHILEWLTKFSGLSNLSRKISLLYDLTEAQLHLDVELMLKVLEKADEATTNYTQLRTAFVLSKASVGDYAGLFKFLKPSFRAIRKAFINYQDAYTWLIDEKEKMIRDEQKE